MLTGGSMIVHANFAIIRHVGVANGGRKMVSHGVDGVAHIHANAIMKQINPTY
jgi:hypothetical protein